MTKQEERQRSNRQDQEAELLLEGGRVLNVYSGELIESNVAVKGERIWYVGPRSDSIGEKTLRLDMSHKVLVPAPSSPTAIPGTSITRSRWERSFAGWERPPSCVTISIFYMMMGVEGFEAFMAAFSKMPVKFFWFIRLVPQTPPGAEKTLSFQRPI